MWRSLAAHLLWEQGVGSSNLPIPTTFVLVRGATALPIYPQPGCRATIAPLAFRRSGATTEFRGSATRAIRALGRDVSRPGDPAARSSTGDLHGEGGRQRMAGAHS